MFLFVGGINAFQKSQLVVLNGHVNAQSYINDVFRPVVVPFMRPYIPRGMFQQDNAKPQTASATMQFLNQNGITFLAGHHFLLTYRQLNIYGTSSTQTEPTCKKCARASTLHVLN